MIDSPHVNQSLFNETHPTIYQTVTKTNNTSNNQALLHQYQALKRDWQHLFKWRKQLELIRLPAESLLIHKASNRFMVDILQCLVKQLLKYVCHSPHWKVCYTFCIIHDICRSCTLAWQAWIPEAHCLHLCAYIYIQFT